MEHLDKDKIYSYIEEMTKFSDQYGIYQYNVLNTYAHTYNPEWCDALKNFAVRKFILDYFKIKRTSMKATGTLPKYNPANILTEYEALIERLPDELKKI